MRHMLAFPLTVATSSGARSQPQSIASRSSTQAPHFFLRGTPTFGSPFSSSVVHVRLMYLFCPLYRRSCSLIPSYFGTSLIFLPTVVVLLWTSLSLRLLSQPASLSTRVRIVVPLRLFVAPCSLPTTCCALVVFTILRLLCLLFQPIRPCSVCTTGPLWLLLAITVSLLGTSPSWPTSLAHSLTFLRVLPLWTLSLTLSRGSSLVVLRITLVVAPGPAHGQGSLSGGMMRVNTLWLLATAHGVTFAALGLLRIRPPPSTVSQHSSFLQDPLLERVAWFCDVPLPPCSLIRRTFRSPVVTPDLCHMQ